MKNYDLMRAILDKIKEYDTIMLFRHIRPDGDCVGATKGMKDILTASFPDKKVYIIDSQHADYLAFLGEDDAEVDDSVYEGALAIVLDTANLDRVSNKKYELCRELCEKLLKGKTSTLSDRNQRDKFKAKLVRYGYSFDVINKAMEGFDISDDDEVF